MAYNRYSRYSPISRGDDALITISAKEYRALVEANERLKTVSRILKPTAESVCCISPGELEDGFFMDVGKIVVTAVIPSLNYIDEDVYADKIEELKCKIDRLAMENEALTDENRDLRDKCYDLDGLRRTALYKIVDGYNHDEE